MSIEQIAGDCALVLGGRVDAKNVAEGRNNVDGVDVAKLLNGTFVPMLQAWPGKQKGAIGGGETVVGRNESAVVCAVNEGRPTLPPPSIPSHCV